jgi:hypothetical protein
LWCAHSCDGPPPARRPQQDRDLTKSGKVIGFDELYIDFNPDFTLGKGNVTVVTNGGMLYGTLRLTQTSMTGKVTGGTGKFKGARGTISAKNPQLQQHADGRDDQVSLGPARPGAMGESPRSRQG